MPSTNDSLTAQPGHPRSVAEEIDADASSAKLENGVLTLTLGKKVPVSNARTLQVL